MEDTFIAFDTIAAFLLAGCLAMAMFSRRELRVARLLLALCTIALAARWIIWAMVITNPWWIRAFVGAIFGAAILGGVPALWKWSKEKEQEPGQLSSSGNDIDLQNVLIRLAPKIPRFGDDLS